MTYVKILEKISESRKSLTPISYALTNKENGRKEWCQYIAIRKSPPKPLGKNGGDDGIVKNFSETKRASGRPKSPKWNRLSRVEKGEKYLSSRVYSPIWSNDLYNTTYASNGSIPDKCLVWYIFLSTFLILCVLILNVPWHFSRFYVL